MDKVTTKNNLALPITVKSIFNYIRSMFWVFVPVFLVEQGFSGFHIGLFLGIANLMAITSTLPAGIANDRVRSKKIILYSLILTAIYYLGLLTVTNVIILAGAFICGGLGRSFFNVSIDSLAYRALDRNKMSVQIGKYVGYVMLIEVLGFIIGGNLINNIGFQNSITAILVLLFVTAIITLFLPITHTFKFKLLEYKKDIFKKEVLIFVFIVFLFTLHYGAEATSYSLFLKNRFLLNLGQTGFFIGGAVFFLALSALYFGKKIEKGFDPRYVFYIGLVISGTGHVLFSLQNNVWIAFLIRCFHEIGDGAMIFSIFYGIVRIFNIERIGGNSSLITFTQILGSSVAAFIFGPLGEYYGYYLPLFISGLTTLISFILLFYLDTRKLQKA